MRPNRGAVRDGSLPIDFAFAGQLAEQLNQQPLAEAIEELVPAVTPGIKWPNDVLLDDRKVAGILAETSSDGEQLVAVVEQRASVSLALSDTEWDEPWNDAD